MDDISSTTQSLGVMSEEDTQNMERNLELARKLLDTYKQGEDILKKTNEERQKEIDLLIQANNELVE
jgi:hypothetical protein